MSLRRDLIVEWNEAMRNPRLRAGYLLDQMPTRLAPEWIEDSCQDEDPEVQALLRKAMKEDAGA